MFKSMFTNCKLVKYLLKNLLIFLTLLVMVGSTKAWWVVDDNPEIMKAPLNPSVGLGYMA
jgi:hypothetical protein